MMISNMKCLLAVTSLMFSFVRHAESLSILESKAIMDLSWDTSSSEKYGLPELYIMQRDVSLYLEKAVREAFAQDPVYDKEVVRLSIDTTEQAASETRHQVYAVVDFIYSSKSGSCVSADTLLMQSVDPSSLPYENVKLTFRPNQDACKILNEFEDTGLTTASLSLIILTSGLSVMLIVITSVLLYITGGYTACCQRVNSCLFVEEIDEEYVVASKATYQDHENDDYVPEAETSEDNQSTETGMTNPSGFLGVVQRENSEHQKLQEQNQQQHDYESNPAAGLGIQAPAREYDLDDETVGSTTGRPLGITSVRKLPKPDMNEANAGLAGMIMQRFTHYQGTNQNE